MHKRVIILRIYSRDFSFTSCQLMILSDEIYFPTHFLHWHCVRLKPAGLNVVCRRTVNVVWFDVFYLLDVPSPHLRGASFQISLLWLRLKSFRSFSTCSSCTNLSAVSQIRRRIIKLCVGMGLELRMEVWRMFHPQPLHKP